MKKLLAITVAVLMLVALVAGCGSNSPAPSTPSSAAPSSSAPAESPSSPEAAETKTIAYITPSTTVDFWNYVQAGIQQICDMYGWELIVYDSKDDAETQLSNAQNAITKKVDAIIISPVESTSCPAVLNIAKDAGIPVVICDIGTESGEYLSYVSTPNYEGAYEVGKYVAEYIEKNNLPKGPIGEVTIPLARINGQNRHNGFKQAMDEAGVKMGTVLQSKELTIDEGYKFGQNIIAAEKDLIGIWSHHAYATMGLVKAVDDAGLTGKVFIACFDGNPQVVQYIKEGKVLVCGAQQPVTMGSESAKALKTYFDGGTPDKEINVPVLLLTKDNINEMEDVAKKTVYIE